MSIILTYTTLVKMELLASIYWLLSDTSVQLGLLVACLFILYRHFIVSRGDGIPPGPIFRLPIIGQLYAVTEDIRIFLRKYRRRYGDIYSLYFGKRLVIIIAGYEKLREAFVLNGHTFSFKPKGDLIINKLTKGHGEYRGLYCQYQLYSGLFAYFCESNNLVKKCKLFR